LVGFLPTWEKELLLQMIAIRFYLALSYYSTFTFSQMLTYLYMDNFNALTSEDKEYILNLPHHLFLAEMENDLYEVLTDFIFIEYKIFSLRPQSIVNDCNLLLKINISPEKREVINLIQNTIRLCTHILEIDPHQIYGQIVGGLLHSRIPKIQNLVHFIKNRDNSYAWICPFASSLKISPLIRTLRGHTNPIMCINILSNGRIISGSRDKTLRIWDLHSGEELMLLEGHTNMVMNIIVLPDTKRFISVDNDRNLKIWEISDGQLVYEFKAGSLVWNKAFAITPDGNWLVCKENGDDTVLQVLDLSTCKRLLTLQGHTENIYSVTITPDGQRVVSVSADKSLIVWDLCSGQKIHTLKSHTAFIYDVAIMPNGKQAISASFDKTLKLWDLETGELLRDFKGHNAQILTVSIFANGKRAIAGSCDNILKVWDIESGKTLQTLKGHTDWIRGIVVTPDNKRAISASDDYTLKVWDLESKVSSVQEEKLSLVEFVVITPDGDKAISASTDSILTIWELKTGEKVKELKGHIGRVKVVAVTPDSCQAISASFDNTLRVWDLKKSVEKYKLKGHNDWVWAVIVTTDGKYAISASSDQTINYWDLSTGGLLHTFRGHKSRVRALYVTSDGSKLVSTSSDCTIKVWDLFTLNELFTLRSHKAGVRNVLVTADAKRAISVSFDCNLKIWDLEKGSLVFDIEGNRKLFAPPFDQWRSLSVITLLPDNRYFLSAINDSNLSIWDLKTGKCISMLKGHTLPIIDIAITPNGEQAISIAQDRTLKIWNLRENKIIASFTMDDNLMTCAISPDGKMAVIGDSSGSVKFFELKGIDLA
jgi:WD40 repeat protein